MHGSVQTIRILLVILVFLFLVSIWIPVYPVRVPQDIDAVFQSIRSDLKMGQFEEARALMTRRLKAKPYFSVNIHNSYPTLQEQLPHRDSYYLDRCRSNLFFTRCNALFVGESRFGIASWVYPVYTTVSFRKEDGSWKLDEITYHHP